MHKSNKRFVIRTASILALFWVASIFAQVGFHASGKVSGSMVLNGYTYAIIAVSQLALILLIVVILAAIWFRVLLYAIALIAGAAALRLLAPGLLTVWQSESFVDYGILTAVLMVVVVICRIEKVQQWLWGTFSEPGRG